MHASGPYQQPNMMLNIQRNVQSPEFAHQAQPMMQKVQSMPAVYERVYQQDPEQQQRDEAQMNDFMINAQVEGHQYQGGANAYSNSGSGSNHKMNANARRSYRNGSVSAGRRGRSSSTKNNFRTNNFLNQTMTQINQGKDREMNPLYNKRSTY